MYQFHAAKDRFLNRNMENNKKMCFTPKEISKKIDLPSSNSALKKDSKSPQPNPGM